MSANSRKSSLILLITLVVFIILTVTAVITGVVLYFLVSTDSISNAENIRPYIGRALIIMFIASSAVGVFVAYIAGRISTRPISKMIHQIDRLASGDYKARLDFGIPLSGNPAFSELSDSFNKMAEALENTEMLREDFINNFSHEFKTPIVSIAGFAKLLKRGDLTDEQRTEYLSVIEEESLRLSYMATNVLNMTRVENQTILTDVTEFNLSEQLRYCVLLLADQWEKKEIDFKVDFSEHFICANEELLKQVWINLISNAIKFSPVGGSVEIGINDDDNMLSVYVINSGEVIPEESLERIFDKFYQVDKSHSSEGNGIGLAIVKKVVLLHEGTVSVQSENNLTMFLVTIPKKR